MSRSDGHGATIELIRGVDTIDLFKKGGDVLVGDSDNLPNVWFGSKSMFNGDLHIGIRRKIFIFVLVFGLDLGQKLDDVFETCVLLL